MPTHYSHIYNATPGSAPLLGDLVTAEIGVNTADLKLFVHDGTAIQDMGGPNDYVKIAPSVGGNKIQPAAGQNMTPIISKQGSGATAAWLMEGHTSAGSPVFALGKNGRGHFTLDAFVSPFGATTYGRLQQGSIEVNGVATSVGRFRGFANQLIVENLSAAASLVMFSLTASPSQSGTMFRIQDGASANVVTVDTDGLIYGAAGTTVGAITAGFTGNGVRGDSDGEFGAYATLYGETHLNSVTFTDAAAYVKTKTVSREALRIEAAPSATTEDLFVAVDDGAVTRLASLTSDATFWASTGVRSGDESGLAAGVNTAAHIGNGKGTFLDAIDGDVIVNDSSTNPQLAVTNRANRVCLALTPAPGQTADIQQWAVSVGTITPEVWSNGAFVLPDIRSQAHDGTSYGYVFMGLFAAQNYNTILRTVIQTPTVIGQRIQGATSQTAALMQWIDGAGSVLSYIDASGNFVPPSDQRLKENVENMPFDLSSFMAMAPKTFTWRDAGNKGAGFIAQAEKANAPYLVNDPKPDAYASFNYEGMTAQLTAAVQWLIRELASTGAIDPKNLA